MQKKTSLVAAILFAGITLPAFAEGDLPPKSLNELVTTCAACHGETGVSTDPQYPHLAGQYQDFLEQALLDYQNGNRKNAIMSGQVANLSEDEIEALAEFFADQDGPLYNFDPN